MASVSLNGSSSLIRAALITGGVRSLGGLRSRAVRDAVLLFSLPWGIPPRGWWLGSTVKAKVPRLPADAGISTVVVTTAWPKSWLNLSGVIDSGIVVGDPPR